MSRGTVSGNGIVTDGLVLSLDAANPKSYPGSGTDIFTLTGVNSNLLGRLAGGATVSDNKIVFDGTDDAIRVFNKQNNSFTVGNYSDILVTTNFTIEQVFQPTFITTGSYFGLRNQLLRKGSGASTLNFWTQVDTSTAIVFTVRNNAENLKSVSFTVPEMLNKINSVTITVNNFSISCYYNGNFIDTKTMVSNPIAAYSNDTMGISDLGVAATYFTGNYYGCKLYNRTLSSTEVLQNYNATKTRFGL